MAAPTLRPNANGRLHRHRPGAGCYMRRLLFIAFHFPPIQGSSGIQRTLSFARNLPAFGWQPTVLTVASRAYVNLSPGSEALVPDTTPVARAFALDAHRHLSIGGRYPDLLAIPDRWQSWIPFGVIRGLRAVRAERLEAVCSTYPIASAHVIGYAVSRLSGLPWIADLRDPMLQTGFPRGDLRRRSFARIEEWIFRHASKVIVTTPGAAEFYIERYGSRAEGRVVVIENGYDEAIFPPRVERTPRAAGDPLVLVHSGLLYGRERDPSNFLGAIRELIDAGTIADNALRIVFRAPGGEIHFDELLARYGLAHMVEVTPAVPYQEALAEMMASDGLLIFQADNCNRQIPAKLYEYVYARVPILGITDPAGDTGKLLRSLGVDAVAKLESQAEIKAMLATALPRLAAGTLDISDDETIAALSRRERSRELARVLDEVVVKPTAPVG